MMWVELAWALTVGAVVTAIWILGLWALSIARRDISFIDTVFTLIVVSVVGVSGVAMGSAPGSRKLLIFALLMIWSIRLTVYLGWRKWGEGEDPRYTKLRGWKDEGWPFHRFALRQVFGRQGVTMFLLCVPMIISLTEDQPRSLGPMAIAGSFIWIIGFAFEAIGDAQLVRFRNNPSSSGRILDTGLWRYTAHPNYFGEVMMAWGLFVVSLDVPWAALGVIGPWFYSRLVLRTTGTPTLEKRLRRTRPGYDDYLDRTSSFWPRPPRRGS